jgi:hypothetical protein
LTNGFPQNASSLIVPNGSISFQLNVDATVIASPFGFVAADLEVVFQFDGNGALIQPAKIYSNKELNPQNSVGLGTYYLVMFYDQNGARLNVSPMWWQFPEASGATVDISAMTPFSTVGGNVIFYPTSFTIAIPTPGPFILGGVFSNPGAPNNFLTSINVDGTVSFRALTLADLPSISASVLSNGVTGTGAVVLAVSPTITGTLSAAAITTTGLITAGAISQTATLTTAVQPTFRLTDSELALSSAVTSITGSVAAIRGNTTLAAGGTISSGFVYGTQGKLTLQGTLANGSGFNAGIFGQVDTSAAGFVHTSGYLAPIMGDFGATSNLATDANANMIALLNTTNCIIHSALLFTGNANYLFDVTDLSFGGAHFVATQTGITTLAKSLKVHVNGTDYYIPMCTGTT